MFMLEMIYSHHFEVNKNRFGAHSADHFRTFLSQILMSQVNIYPPYVFNPRNNFHFLLCSVLVHFILACLTHGCVGACVCECTKFPRVRGRCFCDSWQLLKITKGKEKNNGGVPKAGTGYEVFKITVPCWFAHMYFFFFFCNTRRDSSAKNKQSGW